MDPIISFYESGSTPSGGTQINSGNPIAFGSIQKSEISAVQTIDVWNDKNGSSADDAVAPKLTAISSPDDVSIIFDGTAINGFVSMLEARSCGAFNVPADQQKDWTPIGPTEFLTIGDIPANAKRSIELRLNVPQDADTLALSNFVLRVLV